MIFPHIDINEMGVHLWPVHLDRFSTDHPDQLKCLSLYEKERAASFRFERDRMRYEISHGALRAILGFYLGREPDSVRFKK
jgi:4'-phosphopantetheinyl transferase